MVDIQVLPSLPISKVLFSDVEYVKELVGLGLVGLGKSERVCVCFVENF